MRICDINDFYAPRAGGVKTYHHRKLDYFLRHKEHDYTLVYAGESHETTELAANVRMIRIPGTRVTPDYHFMFNPSSVRKVLKSTQPDIVEIGEPYTLPWVARMANIRKRTPILGYWHADFPVAYVRRYVGQVSPSLGRVCEGLSWWYARRTYGPLRAVMTSSQVCAEGLREHGFSRVRYTPLGVDTDVFTPQKRDPRLRAKVGASLDGSPFDRPLLFFPHRLIEEKGLTVMLEAYSLLAEKTEAILAVAGVGPREHVLRSYMERPPDIHYLGYVAEPESLATWYASSDVVFALSPYETFGLTALEAMASGCPVVTADGGALPELVSGSGCGALVPNDDPGKIADAVLGLLADPKARRSLGVAGREFAVRNHTWELTFSRIVGCYEDVLHERCSRASSTIPISAR